MQITQFESFAIAQAKGKIKNFTMIRQKKKEEKSTIFQFHFSSQLLTDVCGK